MDPELMAMICRCIECDLHGCEMCDHTGYVLCETLDEADRITGLDERGAVIVEGEEYGERKAKEAGE